MALLLLILAAGATAVLTIPVRVDLELDTAAEPRGRAFRVDVRWLFLVWSNAKARVARSDAPPRPPRSARSRPRGRRALGDSTSRFLAALRTRGFVGRASRLGVQLLKALAPRRAEGWVRFGLEDPASTGVLFGVVQPLVVWAQARTWPFRLEPAFTGAAFAGHARFVWAVRPGALLWPVGAFMASPTTWRAAFAAWRAGTPRRTTR